MKINKSTDRNAVYVVSSICKALYDLNLLTVEVDSLVINRSSF